MTYKDIPGILGSVASSIRIADALDLIGLERRRSTMSFMLPTLGAFGLGIAVGAGLGLLFAPKPGARLRDDLSKKVNRLADDMKSAAETAEAEVKSSLQPKNARTDVHADVNGH